MDVLLLFNVLIIGVLKMKSLAIYTKTAQGTSDDLLTVITLSSADECLDIADRLFSNYLWAWLN